MKSIFKNHSGCFFKYSILLLLVVLVNGFAKAQDTPRQRINKNITSINTFAQTQATEKIYLQTDKPAYATGDTLWFKGYVFEAAYLNASAKSGIMYLEIASDSNRVMKRIMLPLYMGITFGHLLLDKDIPQGGYTLRAYTNWMRNFGEDYVFKKHFYISNTTDQDWLINYNPTVSKQVGKDKVQLSMRVTQLDKDPVRVREMQMRLTDGRRTWFKSDVQTDLDGMIKVNFDLPEKANTKNLSVTVQDMRKGQGNRKLLVPVMLNRAEGLDVQFMPEGGNLVAGLPARVAFKAINEDGLAANISGAVYDSKEQQAAPLNTGYKGMGTFNFTPVAGEAYVAKIRLPNGSFKNYPLPAVAPSGITMLVNNPYKADSCEVIISATPDVAASSRTYFLTGLARGTFCYGASFRFSGGVRRFMIGKNTFPGGIARFVLSGPDQAALNERIIFIDHADNLNIKLTPNKAVYAQRDSVALNIEVADKDGNPVQGSFSLAVTDDGQVKTDSMTNTNIITHLLLTSDLKGTVETPGYYANARSSALVWQQLNLLLLTQGWVGYNWNDVFKPAKAFTYDAEKEFLVKGKVTNAFNKPVAKSGVTLLSKKPLLVLDTLTNEQGKFTFTGITPADTAIFFIQAKNKRGKSFNVGIEMDEFQPPVFAAVTERMVPWYVNIDTADLLSAKKQMKLKADQERITRGTVLKAVEVKAKKVVKQSKNLNGPGEADVIIDEEELGKAGRTTLGDLLEKRVKGFYLRYKKGVSNYSINDQLVHLVIDGVDIDFFYDETMLRKDYYKQYLDYYDAEEIKGIEVMKGGKYSMSYTSRFLEPMAIFYEHAFIEVTTRGGQGPFMKKAVGTYLYKPMPFAATKTFYTPKYKANSTPDMTDIRSTIHWAPNVVTGKNGKATVSFYTADNAGSYTVIIEGSDMAGNIGMRGAKLEVKKQLVN